MSRIGLYILFIASILLTPFKTVGQANIEGINLANSGKYAEALEKFESVLNETPSASVFYNAGSSALHLEEFGKGIYYLERAQLLRPNSSIVKRNLTIAQKQAGVQVRKSHFFLQRWFWNIRDLLFSSSWGILLLIGWCGLAYFFFRFYSTSQKSEKKSHLIKMIFLIPMVCLFALFGFSRNQIESNNPYLISKNKIEVFTAADKLSELAFKLNAGEKLLFLDRIGSYYKIETPSGSIGWIERDKVYDLNLRRKNG